MSVIATMALKKENEEKRREKDTGDVDFSLCIVGQVRSRFQDLLQALEITL